MVVIKRKVGVFNFVVKQVSAAAKKENWTTLENNINGKNLHAFIAIMTEMFLSGLYSIYFEGLFLQPESDNPGDKTSEGEPFIKRDGKGRSSKVTISNIRRKLSSHSVEQVLESFWCVSTFIRQDS